MRKKIAVVLVFILLILLVLNWPADPSNQSSSQPLLAQRRITDDVKSLSLTALIPVDMSVNNTEPAAPAKNPSKDCMPQAEYSSSPALATLENWFLEHIGIGLIANENYLNKAELTEQAHAGNAYAMLLLGQNYLWHVKNASFYSPIIRPMELPKLDDKERPYDVKTMVKARFWLEQAALHGMVGGLDDLGMSYASEMRYMAKQKAVDEDKKIILSLTTVAYRELMDWLLPDFYGNDVLGSTVPPEYQESLIAIVNELKAKWRKDRLALGFEVQLNIEVPPELEQLKAINICRD